MRRNLNVCCVCRIKQIFKKEKTSDFWNELTSDQQTEIKQAIESIFNVRVAAVKTMQITGKIKQRGRITGKRRDWKKAIVKLMPGERIDFFEGA